MSDFSATVILKKTEDDKYCFEVEHSESKHLFDFLFWVLQKNDNYSSDWMTPQSPCKLTPSYKFQIKIYTLKDIINDRDPKEVIRFGQDSFLITDNNSTFLPIIHVLLTDILDNIFFESIEKQQNNRNHFNKLHHSIPRYFQIMDNSIWNYFVPLVNEKSFYAHFTKAVKCIHENYQNGLYEQEVAIEYAEVNARILSQTYLCGSHAHGVAPFIFHSESAIEKKRKDRFKALIADDDELWPWLWRLLLVDDKAIEIHEDNNSELKKNCKLSIIKRLLENALFPQKDGKQRVQYRLLGMEDNKLKYLKGMVDGNARIVIDCVQTYDDAVAALKDRKYDLILLDYLLDSKNGQRQYGYELLEEIDCSAKIKKRFDKFSYRVDYSSPKEKAKALKKLLSENARQTAYNELINFIGSLKDGDNNITIDSISEDNIDRLFCIIQTAINEKQFKIGANRKLFIIFISAYSSAVNERLLAQGLNRSEDHWHIITGACPTNTPQLFTYNLLHLMNKRLNGCGILKLSTNNILELVERIFKPQNEVNDKNNSVRKRAGKYYQEVLSLQYHHRRMLDDVEIPHDCNKNSETLFDIKGSVLISHYSYQNQHLGGVLEHLTNLVHIAAFGTIRQWDEMWEEYLYFKANFGALIHKEDEDAATTFRKVCGYIETFILRLKSQQR